MTKIETVKIFLILFLSTLSFAGGNQFNLNFGADLPDSGSTSGLAKFVLQTKPAFFRGQTSFAAVAGGSKMMGEFGLGASMYFLASLIESSRIQPFIGGEGMALIGRTNSKGLLSGGWGAFTGVDMMIFGKKSGITTAIEVAGTPSQSVRVWLGIFSFKLD